MVTGRSGGGDGSYDTYVNDGAQSPGGHTGVVGVATEIQGTNGNWILTNAPVAPAPNITDGNWHLVTETITTGAYQCYVDGTLVQTLALNPAQTPVFCYDASQYLSVGINGSYGSLNGEADFQLFGSVLTAGQIQQLYSSEAVQILGGLPSTTPVTVAARAQLRPQRTEPDDRLAQRSGHRHHNGRLDRRQQRSGRDPGPGRHDL